MAPIENLSRNRFTFCILMVDAGDINAAEGWPFMLMIACVSRHDASCYFSNDMPPLALIVRTPAWPAVKAL